jgi:hypothetical protein
VKELTQYLLDNLILDFNGDVTLEAVRKCLLEDDGRESRRLLAKLHDEKTLNDMLVTLADCLREQIQSGISGDVVTEQLDIYSES